MATILLLLVCALGGGSARVDPLSLLYLRPLVALLLAVLLLFPARDGGAARGPLILLGAWVAAIAVQLAPLPPGLWTILPGHARFAPLAGLVGTPAPWRPLSLVPTLTANALAALLPAWAGLIAASRLGRHDLARIVPALLVVAGASVLLGALQIATGTGYPYDVTSPGLPVGLFANRNHQAAFLAAMLPLAAAWAWPRHTSPWDRVRPWVALGGALLAVVFLAVTGSRAGLALGALGLVAAGLLAPPFALPLPPALRRRRGWLQRAMRVAPLALALLALGVAIALGRSLATERLVAATAEAEGRVRALPTLTAMLRDTLPFGAGFGTFDPVFRIYEPDALLHRSVFNHAHDDLLEVALTGGVPALAVLAAFLVWFARRIVVLARAWRAGARDRLGVAAAMSLALLLGASLVDYPLRTPLLGLVAALLVAVVARAGERLAAAGPRG